MPNKLQKRYRIKAYNAGSRSAKALANSLKGLVLLDKKSKFVPRKNDVIINWGSQDAETLSVSFGVDYLNRIETVREASNKLLFFRKMAASKASHLIPDFWCKREDIPDNAFPVVCRTLLTSHSGRGIVIANKKEDLVEALLYVKYIKKQDEYRIHVGAVDDDCFTIAEQRKARNTEEENPNWKIRNHDNGFVFVRGGFTTPRCVIDAAHHCFMITGLDFGAVDVVYNAAEDRAYVLEINTAPGLEGQTITDYSNFFSSNF